MVAWMEEGDSGTLSRNSRCEMCVVLGLHQDGWSDLLKACVWGLSIGCNIKWTPWKEPEYF